MRPKGVTIGLLCFLFTAGSAWARETAAPGQEKRPVPVAAEPAFLSSANSEIPFVQELTLVEALARALKYSPALAASAWQVRAREAAALQAGLLPNPELSVEAENLLGTGGLSGTGAAETTAVLSQLIELGGKRAKRRAVASLDAELADWDYQTQRLEVLTGTGQAFIALLAAQQATAQAEELSRLAEDFFISVSERVEAGKVSPVERHRAQVTVSEARTALAQAQETITAARRRLAAAWGSAEPSFGKVVGSLGKLGSIPSAGELEKLLADNPELARWETEVLQRRKMVDLAKARRVPDLTVSLGARNFRETNDNAAVMGVSIPLPVFDRNQGGIAEAQAELSRARHQQAAARSEALAALAEKYRDLNSAYLEARSLEGEILPAARQAFEAARLGYEEGKFGFLDLLDAQRSLFEVTRQYSGALADYHQARLEVERLIGRPLQVPAESSSSSEQ